MKMRNTHAFYHTTITFLANKCFTKTRRTTRSAIEDNRKIRFTMEPAHVRRI